jgi:hypothetical protein
VVGKPKFDDLIDQLQRQGLVEWEFDCPFAICVLRHLFIESFGARGNRIDRNVVFPSCETDQVLAVQLERADLVTDLLARFRDSCLDGGPKLAQMALGCFGTGGDVFID